MNNELVLSPRLKESVLCPLSTKRNNSPEGLVGDGEVSTSLLGTLAQSSELQDRSRCLKARREMLQCAHPQLKDECKNLLKCCPQAVVEPIQQLVKHASSMLKKTLAENLKLKEEKTSLQNLLRTATQNCEQLQLKLKSINQQTKPSDPLKKLQEHNNLLTLKNLKLQAELEELMKNGGKQDSTKQSTSTNNCSSLEQVALHELEGKLQMMHLENNQMKEQRDQLAYVLNNLRMEVSKLNSQLQVWKMRYAKQEKQIEALGEVADENQRLNRFRQLFFMCREEKEALEYNSHAEAQRLRKVEIQVRRLREKLLSFSALIGKGTFQVMEDEEQEALTAIRINLDKDDGFRKLCMSHIKPTEKFDRYQHMYQPAGDTPTPFNLQERIYVPSIFCLYDEGIKEFEVDMKVCFSKPVVPEIFLKVRAIMDSRYNEYLINGPHSCRFVDFTYGFLEKFDVDTLLKKVVAGSGKQQQISYRRRKFLCCLFHPKIQTHSEILVFREFLLGRHSEDEVYYYLSCRNLILKGPQLENFCAVADPAVFVHYEHLNRCLNLLLSRYNPQVQNMVLHNINLRKKKKAGRYCIESGYVLRALLEVYRSAKQNKLEKLRGIFQRIEECTNEPDMKFAHFRELLELNFHRAPITELSASYRQVLSLSKGNPDFFGCFVAAASQKMFCYAVAEEFDALMHRGGSYQGKSSMLAVDPLPLMSLGLETLMADYQRLLRLDSNSVQDCYYKSILLNKVVLLLSCRREFREECFSRKNIQLVEYFCNQLQTKIIQVSKLTKERARKDQQLNQAATVLTRYFGAYIRNFYATFVGKLNQRISRIGKENVSPT